MSRRAAEYKRTSLSGEERKARLKQRCMEDVAAKRSKLIRSLRNAPGSVSQVGHSIVEAMQSECAAVDPEDPHAGLTEGEYQEIMVSLEDALMTLVVEEERVAKLAGARRISSALRSVGGLTDRVGVRAEQEMMEMFQASVHLKEVTLTPQEVRPPRSPDPLL